MSIQAKWPRQRSSALAHFQPLIRMIDDCILESFRIEPVKGFFSNLGKRIHQVINRWPRLRRVQCHIPAFTQFNPIGINTAPEIFSVFLSFRIGKFQVVFQHHFPNICRVNRHPAISGKIKLSPAVLPFAYILNLLFSLADTEYLPCGNAGGTCQCNIHRTDVSTFAARIFQQFTDISGSAAKGFWITICVFTGPVVQGFGFVQNSRFS